MINNPMINEEYLRGWLFSFSPEEIEVEAQCISATMMMYGIELEKQTISDESRINFMISFACCMIKLAYLTDNLNKIFNKGE